jgi:carboxyl-terminal processing protease
MRYLIVILALLATLVVGIRIGANPDTPVLGPLKDVVAPERTTISPDQVQSLIEEDFYRKVPPAKLTDGSIGGMVRSLKDPYSHYFDAKQNKDFEQAISGSDSGVGMAVGQHKRGLLVTVIYPGAPAAGAGIRRGDIITKVDGRSIAGQSADLAVTKIKGPAGTRVKLTWAKPRAGGGSRLGAERSAVLTRKKIDIPVARGKIISRAGRKIGYVQLASFTETSGRLVSQQVAKLKRRGATAWVLDLRGNGGGRLDQAVAVSSVFLPDGMIVATDGRSIRRKVYDAIAGRFATAAPLAVLVDKGSASASEITSGALKYRDRGLIVGTRTFGKGVFQEVTELTNGGAVSLTVGRYELPGRHFIGKRGLAPDLTVRDNVKTSRDEQLAAALAALAKFKSAAAKR